MGRISDLPDDLLIKILSYLPTKEAVSTSILSKQWEFLWMWLTKLEFGNKNDSLSECNRLRCFLNRNLPLHRAPVLDKLCLHLRNSCYKPEDIKMWVLFAVSRHVRELEIHYSNEPDILPRSLFTCKSLETLELYGRILVNVPRMVSLPCLKTLVLEKVIFFNEDSLQRILSNSPVLEELLVDACRYDEIRKFTVISHSLEMLTLYMNYRLDEFVIDTPSLEYFKLQYYNSKSRQNFMIKYMPNLFEANIDVCFPHIDSLLRSITSVKRLSLCLKDVYGDGFVFNKLIHLRLCECQDDAFEVLVQVLKDSPKLTILEILQLQNHYASECMTMSWNQPNTVPPCILSSLKILKWSDYIGRQDERDVANYILKNAYGLKAVAIYSNPFFMETHDMLKELAISHRASTSCQLLFR